MLSGDTLETFWDTPGAVENLPVDIENVPGPSGDDPDLSNHFISFQANVSTEISDVSRTVPRTSPKRSGAPSI
jgi:hypothetical protein